MASLINKDVEFTEDGRRKRGFVYRRLGGQYEVIGEDDVLRMVDCALCHDIDEEDLTEGEENA